MTYYRDTFVKWSLRGLSAFIIAVVALVLYWLVIDRTPPAIIHGGQVTRYERQDDGSWIMFVKWTGERFRLCWGNSKRWLSDTTILPLVDIPYPPDIAARPLGPLEWEVPIAVPAFFANTGHSRGTYRIRIFYACNPLQEYLFPIVVEPPPVPFEIPTEQQNELNRKR